MATQKMAIFRSKQYRRGTRCKSDPLRGRCTTCRAENSRRKSRRVPAGSGRASDVGGAEVGEETRRYGLVCPQGLRQEHRGPNFVVTTIFNPAPGPPSGLPDDFFKYSDIICPNENEVSGADKIWFWARVHVSLGMWVGHAGVNYGSRLNYTYYIACG